MNYTLNKRTPEAHIGTKLIFNTSTGRYHLNGNVQENSYSKETVESDNGYWFSPITNTLEEIIEEEFRLPQGDMMLLDNNYQILNSEAKTIATKAAKRYASSILNSAIEIIEKEKQHLPPQITYGATNYIIDKIIYQLLSILKESE